MRAQAAPQSLSQGISNISPLGALESPLSLGFFRPRLGGLLFTPSQPHSIRSLAGTSYTPWGQGSSRSCPGLLPAAPSISRLVLHEGSAREGESERLPSLSSNSDRNGKGGSSPGAPITGGAGGLAPRAMLRPRCPHLQNGSPSSPFVHPSALSGRACLPLQAL